MNSESAFGNTPSLTAREVIDLIESKMPPRRASGTLDTFKCGDEGVPVRGIVTTFMATRAVLDQAVAAGANLVITHEPSFYNHLDDTTWLEKDPVCHAKQTFLRKNGLILWRFHDGWHRIRPDGIIVGEERQLGWKTFKDPAEERIYRLPEQSLRSLVEHCKKSLGIGTVRVAGDLDMKCSEVALLPGAAGGERQIRMLGRPDVQVVICGESAEWETCEYVRDAAAAGEKKALIILGHANSEEAGMAWFAEWLRPLLPSHIPLTHLVAGDPFQFL